MQMAIDEMKLSKSEHEDRVDPKVGAIISDPDGHLIAKAHRGENRVGDHAEYTLFERKLVAENVEGFILYTTLEPCVRRNPPKKGCTFRTIDARVGKVVIGHLDPDPSVSGKGVGLLENKNIEIDYFDKDLEQIIHEENLEYFKEKEVLAKQVRDNEIQVPSGPLEIFNPAYDLNDLSEEAQLELINRMELSFKLGSKEYLKFINQFGITGIDENNVQKPTGLGLLLLGKKPEIAYPQARVKLTVHRENSEPIIQDFNGPLVIMPIKIEKYIDIIFPKEINREEFHRKELSTVPKKALREVIINAIVHRDYSIEGAKIMIDVYDNRIAIMSPGIPKFSIDRFKSFTVPSVSRNPKIAYIFNQMGLVEERGLGIKELHKLKLKGLQSPHFELIEDLFYTIIYRAANEKEIDIINNDNKVILHESENKGFEYLKEMKVLSSSQYAKHFNVDSRTARRHLNKLISNDLAIREGSGNAIVYRIKS